MRRWVNGQVVELPASEATVTHCGDRWDVRASQGTKSAVIAMHGDAVLVSYQGRQFRVERSSGGRGGKGAVAGEGEIRASTPGQVVDVRVVSGQFIERGSVLAVLEAMKTQQALLAPFDGFVESVSVAKGDQVSEGVLLVKLIERTDKTTQ